MELQKFIDHNPDYIDIFKKKNLKIKKYKHDLIIVKKKYNDVSKVIEKWEKYCRGVVINTKSNKIVCIPPVKSTELKDDFESYLKYEEIQELIDGTMINLFHINNEWIISTRSEIGGHNRWNQKKTFRQMFDECSKLDYDDLVKTNCYSFVMRHIENRNISKITKNELYLVEMYDLENEIERVSRVNYPDDILSCSNLFTPYIIGEIANFSGQCNFSIKGYTIKINSERYNIINPNYTKVENLNANSPNDLMNYIELRKNGNLKEYLIFYPEKSEIFKLYRNQIHELSNELYSNYKDVFIFKSKDKKEIPYHLKPFVFEIHSEYLKSKKPTSWQDIKGYIQNLPTKRLVFSMNYMN